MMVSAMCRMDKSLNTLSTTAERVDAVVVLSDAVAGVEDDDDDDVDDEVCPDTPGAPPEPPPEPDVVLFPVDKACRARA